MDDRSMGGLREDKVSSRKKRARLLIRHDYFLQSHGVRGREQDSVPVDWYLSRSSIVPGYIARVATVQVWVPGPGGFR